MKRRIRKLLDIKRLTHKDAKASVTKGNVLEATRDKVGPTGHVRRNGHIVECGTLDQRGFTMIVSSSLGWGTTASLYLTHEIVHLTNE